MQDEDSQRMPPPPPPRQPDASVRSSAERSQVPPLSPPSDVYSRSPWPPKQNPEAVLHEKDGHDRRQERKRHRKERSEHRREEGSGSRSRHERSEKRRKREGGSHEASRRRHDKPSDNIMGDTEPLTRRDEGAGTVQLRQESSDCEAANGCVGVASNIKQGAEQHKRRESLGHESKQRRHDVEGDNEVRQDRSSEGHHDGRGKLVREERDRERHRSHRDGIRTAEEVREHGSSHDEKVSGVSADRDSTERRRREDKERSHRRRREDRRTHAALRSSASDSGRRRCAALFMPFFECTAPIANSSSHCFLKVGT
jgi:hypothetical protein